MRLTAGDIAKTIHTRRRKQKQKEMIVDEHTLEITIKGSPRLLSSLAHFLKMIESATQRDVEGWYGIQIEKGIGNLSVHRLPKGLNYVIRNARHWIHYTDTPGKDDRGK